MEAASVAAAPALGSRVLAWALATSAVVHAGLLVVPLTLGGTGHTTLPGPRGDLQVALTPAVEAAPAVLAQAAIVAPRAERAAQSPAHIAHARPRDAARPVLPPAEAETPAPARAEAQPPSDAPVDIAVTGQPFFALARIGDELVQRSWQEFPIEVAWPVRVDGEIRAHYPAAALAAGLEGSVIAWVIVDWEAKVEEIRIAEGEEPFAQAAIDAINAAHFEPAVNRGLPIRFPIALEFRFELPASGAPPQTIAAHEQ